MDRREHGFTLIELLVVVMIIGILASMAVPQFFKVVERAKVSEVHNFVSAVRSAQERYLARHAGYSANIQLLDVSFTNCNGAGQGCGMRDYAFQAIALTPNCGSATDNGPGYTIRVQRTGQVAARYGAYNVWYDRCGESFNFQGCPACNQDLN